MSPASEGESAARLTDPHRSPSADRPRLHGAGGRNFRRGAPNCAPRLLRRGRTGRQGAGTPGARIQQNRAGNPASACESATRQRFQEFTRCIPSVAVTCSVACQLAIRLQNDSAEGSP